MPDLFEELQRAVQLEKERRKQAREQSRETVKAQLRLLPGGKHPQNVGKNRQE